MECDKVRERLAAYIEGIVDTAEGPAIGSHLSNCAKCRMAMKDLKKTENLLKSLEEIEPPPWLSDKVMAGVRQEAEEKGGLLRWLFYPLRIKIPVEAFTILLVVGLVAYVYKVNAPRFEAAKSGGGIEQSLSRGDLSSLPANGEHKDEMRAPSAATANDAGRGRGIGAAGLPREADDNAPAAAASGFTQPADEQAQELRAGAPQAKVGAEALPSGASSFRSGQGALEQRVSPYDGSGNNASSHAFQTEISASRQAGTTVRQESVPAPAAPLAAPYADKTAAKEGLHRVDVTIRVKDVSKTSREVESMLKEAGAIRLFRESLDATESIGGIVRNDRMDGLLQRLRAMGDLGDFTSSPEIGNEVSLRILVKTVAADKGKVDEKVSK